MAPIKSEKTNKKTFIFKKEKDRNLVEDIKIKSMQRFKKFIW